MSKSKFYVEISTSKSSDPFILQSRWFDSTFEAIEWAKKIDCLSIDCKISLMASDFEDGVYGDICFVCDIRALMQH